MRWLVLTIFAGCCFASEVFSQEALLSGEASLIHAGESIWPDGLGCGMRSGTTLVESSAGVMVGVKAFGSVQQHDLALATISYGWLLGETKAKNHWWRGNCELRLEFSGGAQYHPSTEWVLGLTPHLRYHFATGSRIIPFLDAGLGVSATSIGPPDLSGTFEFNTQGGGGIEWFLRENMALTLEGRYMHMSCAGINQPNLGMNGVILVAGLTWFY
jgi:lipid A 3-O-deacylase